VVSNAGLAGVYPGGYLLNLNDLIDECARCIKADIQIMLCMKTRPTGFPRGDLACETDKGKITYYDPLKVLAWCQKVIKELTP
jgi:hypothetical protein